ncbi:hypothetical protein EOT10_17925 [Streptomyces antnestii]|uniref:DUF6801 domain-containing protein n=1 Tax=Streptomyces antnestii TaxID=2494256 RepID=A0A437PNT7_9ACTN|nr:DUF6801 domain-containing protein [Streptomyces sp. San01]RVU23927.1 hypothetical protein EOT10_17925 [Streptomyces sp. San01]
MKIILGAATALAAASGLSVIGAGTAAAQPLTRTFGYTCSSSMIGDQPITVKIDSDVPKSVAVGESSKTIAVDAVATVGASFTQWLSRAGMTTLEGTVEAQAHVAAPQHDFGMTVPFHMAKTSVPASGPFKVPATASVATPTFKHPGRGTVTAGNLTLHLLAKNANGSQWLSADAPCTLNAGQSNVVTSFDITTPVASASPTPRPTTAAPSPATGSAASPPPRPTTRSTVAGVPKPATSQGTGPTTGSATATGHPSAHAPSTAPRTDSTRPTPRSTTPAIVVKSSAGGQDTKDLILLAVGVLVACAAAFVLGRRVKNQRLSGDDGADQQHIDPKQGLLIEGVKDPMLDVVRHSEDVNAADPRHRGHGTGVTSRSSTGRRLTDGQNLLLRQRHVLHRVRHQKSVGARTCGGAADPNSQPLSLPQGEDVHVVIEEQPSTGYVRQG